MLVCSALYYFISAASVRGDGNAWLIILLLNMICFFKIIVENTINISKINNNIASQPLNSGKDKSRIFYIVKSALETGMLSIYLIYFVWNVMQSWVRILNSSDVTDFSENSGLVKLFACILCVVLFYEDAENIFLVEYCSADSVDAKNEIRKEFEQ